MIRLFISHSSIDKDKIVRPLVHSLKQHGIKTWYDEENILEGYSIAESVFRGLKSSDFIILIITPAVWQSNWVWLETGGYLLKGKPVIPILWEVSHETFATKFPFLADRKYMVADNNAPDFGIRKITERLKERISKYKQQNFIYESNVDIPEIIIRLHKYSIEKTSELVSFIRRYEKNRYDPEDAFVWMKRIVDLVLIDILNYDTSSLIDMTSDQVLNKNICPQLTQIVINHFKLFSKVDAIFMKTASISDEQYQLLELSLLSILDWYTQNFASPQLDISADISEKLVVVYPQDFTKEDIIETYYIEKMVLREDLISPWEEAYNWFLHNNEIFMGVRSCITKKIIAFSTILPVSDEWYDKFLVGNLLDTSMDLLDIRKYDLPDFYNIYISSICTNPAYSSSSAFTLLYNSIMEKFLELAKQEKYVYRLLAEASTLDGERLCHFINMKKVGSTTHKTNIYENYLIPPSFRLKSKMGKKLIDYYCDKYESLKDLL